MLEHTHDMTINRIKNDKNYSIVQLIPTDSVLNLDQYDNPTNDILTTILDKRKMILYHQNGSELRYPRYFWKNNSWMRIKYTKPNP